MAYRKPFPWASALIVLGGLLVGLAGGLIVFYSAPPSTAAPAAVKAPTVPAGSVAQPAGAALPAPAPVVGAPAPDFTLADLSGAQVSLASYKGQVVLLNFWATWCPPCKLEMPTLQQHYADYQAQGLMVLGVEAGDPKTDVQDFATQQRLTFPILLDEKAAVTDLYRVDVLPITYLIDRQGVIVQKHTGMMTEAQVDGYLAELGLTKP
jgi:peroxiredoxin